MSNKKLKDYIIGVIVLLKELAGKAKEDADNSQECLDNFAKGVVMGYYSIITTLKHQACTFCVDQKELGLADIKPDTDLLDLHRNPDVDFGEDNWTVDVMNEEKAKGFLSDSIALLKEQAREAKQDADNPKEGFKNYNAGSVMAYYAVFSLLKQQALAFNIDEKEVGLADIDPKMPSIQGRTE